MKVSSNSGRQQYHAVGYKRVSTADQATEGQASQQAHRTHQRQRAWITIHTYHRQRTATTPPSSLNWRTSPSPAVIKYRFP